MPNNSQSRKHHLVINNPDLCGFEHRKIKEQLRKLHLAYYCMADEIADTGTKHTHLFIYSECPIRFNTIKKLFPIAHIEKAYGSVSENRDYIKKEGKWKDTDKSETSIPGSFEEEGSIPTENQEKSPLIVKVMEDLKAGRTTAEIVEENPTLAFKIKHIEELRQTLLKEKYSTEYRDIKVVYIYGATGTGKTSSIYAENDPKEVCRVTTYRLNQVNFDAYDTHDVLVFEEFHGQIPIREMLNYLDRYPLLLPARYTDRVACFTKVYITSNLPLSGQYMNEQTRAKPVWEAFLRRITEVREQVGFDQYIIHRKEEYL